MIALLKKLTDFNIRIDVIDEQLDIQAPKGVMTREILDEIRSHKQELLSFVKTYKKKQSTDSFQIPQAKQSSYYPLSSSQRRLWLLSQIEGGSVAYNMPSIFLMKGELEIPSLEKAFIALISRHESLRTIFKESESGKVNQVVLDADEFDFQLQYKNIPENFTQEQLKEELQQETRFQFDLSKDMLLRAKLLKTGENNHFFIFVVHHIISDGWSSNVMTSELFTLYEAIRKGQGNPLAPLRIHYKDYSSWQQKQLENEENDAAKQYWLKQFEGTLPVVELPHFVPRPLTKSYKGKSIRKHFKKDLVKKISDLCLEEESTLFMGLLASLKILLFRYTDKTDLVVGSPIAGRRHTDLQNQVGFYVNTLALRTQFDGADGFLSILKKVKHTTLEAYEYQQFPFDELVENLHIQRDKGRNPLFEVVLTVQEPSQLDIQGNKLDDLEIKEFEIIGEAVSKFDLEFTFLIKDGLDLVITYNTDIFDDGFAERSATHLENLLLSIIEAPNLPAKELKYIGHAEEKELLVDFNDTAVDFPKEKTIVNLFEEQVKKTPDKTAIIFEETKLSYQQLNELANQFANYLTTHFSIDRDDLVGVKLERSEKVMIAILGILKAGAAYVPIDINYPAERISYIEKDTKSKIVVDDELIQKFLHEKENYGKDNPCPVNQPNDLAYVIYTSGTTGAPKGVMVEHHNVVSSVIPGSYFPLGENQVLLATAAMSFDPTTTEFFGTLLNGSLLVFPNQKDLLDLDLLRKRINDNKVDSLWMTSSWFNQVVEKNIHVFENVKQLIIGGDVLSVSHITMVYDKWPEIKIINGYGPTENTTFSTTYEILRHDYASIPIGRPICNGTVFILDEQFQIVPIGVTGKLYVGGTGVARGFLNKEELTQQKFIPNPFNKTERMYDSGDLARWLPDGNIDFVGRKDHQIKIRGFRIELEEIESNILQYGKQIKHVVVEARTYMQEQVLTVYLVATEPVDMAALRNFLLERLPAYMVPLFYIELSEMPLTPNGKIARKSLPQITEKDLIRKKYVGPRNNVEESLVAIWKEVLGLEKIGVTDDFFELGGNSLIIAQVLNRIHKALNKSVSFKIFFNNPTVEKLAIRLQKREYSNIPVAAAAKSYPLTPAQKRLWILSQMEGGSVAYNMPSVLELNGTIHPEIIEKAFSQLLIRYDILRTYFKETTEGEIRQWIRPADSSNFRMERIDYSAAENQKAVIQNYLEKENNRTFDLQQAPLIRVALLKTKENQAILFFSIHHLISDGWSQKILLSELIHICNSLTQGTPSQLPKLQIQYKDYAVWQNDKLHSEEYKKLENYWVNQLDGEIPVLELPRFKKRPLLQTYNGDTVTHHFSKEFSTKLRDFAKQQDATLFMTLVSGVKALLYRYSGQKDIILGTPIAGRAHPFLENQIGLFLNTLALRTKIEKDWSFSDFLKSNKDTLIDAYEHQSYPFDELVDQLNLKRDLSRSAIFDVMIVLQNQAQLSSLSPKDVISGMTIKPFQFSKKSAQFDLNFIFFETDTLGLAIDYNTDIYDPFLIERMVDHLENIFSQSIDQPQKPIDQIDLLDTAERNALLETSAGDRSFFPKDKTITDLFEEQAAKTPETTALIFEEKTLSYQELSEKSNQLANYLITERNLSQGEFVGIKLNRSEWLSITMIAVLKAGGTYIPIDPQYPTQRIKFIENDSDCKLKIDQNFLEDFLLNEEKYSKSAPKIDIDPNQFAYIIYTSGSTGKPKGVKLNHNNAVAMIYWAREEFKNTPYDLMYAVTSHCFDLSIYELFYPLSIGKNIRMLKSGLEIGDYLEHDRKVLVNTVPSVVQALVHQGETFKNVVAINLAGEVVPISLSNGLPKERLEVRNLYGPSEDTTYSSCFRIASQFDHSIPVGRPISNTRFYILSPHLKLQAVGVVGEIYISGAGLSTGYLNRPALTSERFMPCPFEDGIMYKTGDLARWLPDGNIEFIGRVDYQVKIRGYRIELGEIDHILQLQKGVLKAVTAVNELIDEKFLFAYVVVNDEFDKNEVLANMKELLPSYMVPDRWAILDAIPLTPNGKIDYQALAKIENIFEKKREFIAPRNEVEQELRTIWKEVLKLDDVSVTENFFELGGNSLKAMLLISRIKKVFHPNIKIEDVFHNQSLELLAKKISNKATEGNVADEKIKLIPHMDKYAVSFRQKLMLNIAKEGDGTLYNMPILYTINGEVQIELFKKALSAVIERHEVLRTIYFEVDNVWYQKVLDSLDMDALFNYTEEKIPWKEFFVSELVYKFDFEKVSFKIDILKTGESEYLLSTNFHHLIGDGWSINIFLKDLITIYGALINEIPIDLKPLPFQYKDYAYYMNEKLNSTAYKEDRIYHLERFKGFRQKLKFPALKEKREKKVISAETIILHLSMPKAREIALKYPDKFGGQHSLNTILTALVYRTIADCLGENDITIGMPYAARMEEGTREQIGFYIDSLVFRINEAKDTSFSKLLNSVSKQFIEITNKRSYPFQELIEELDLDDPKDKFSIYKVRMMLDEFFALNDFDELDSEKLGMDVDRFYPYTTRAKKDLSFFFTKRKEALRLDLEYNMNNVPAEFAAKIATKFTENYNFF